MNYRLAVLTHGDMAPLRQTLDSFQKFVSPQPAHQILYIDGWSPWTMSTSGVTRLFEYTGMFFETISSPGAQSGFCKATGNLWRQASEDTPGKDEITHVFWLEHDFVFTRHIDLVLVARVMEDCCEDLAQMTFMRGPVNTKEKKAGGVVNDLLNRGHTFTAKSCHEMPWIRHRAYFTTNPSLMTRKFMTRNPWIDAEEECEGKFGLELIADGYHFGIWDGGNVYCNHIGRRTGTGY